ncbi:MAG: response regulator [Candidatus Aegiribacteria sp.]|nr:response regulator [Candidatus Aegiribacteria sp.]
MPLILIIDDDPMIREMLITAFHQENYDVMGADNGKTALDIFRTEDVDVVITDIIMPDMEGIETIREFRKIKPDAKIIAFSGGGSLAPDGYLKIASSMGAQYTFQKPISIKVLSEAVKDLLGSCKKKL